MPEVISARTSRSLVEVLKDIETEVLDFVETRLRMAYAEFEERRKAMKASFPILVVAGLLLTTSFLLFSLAIVSVVAMAFGDNLYRWPIAFFIVALVWLIGGGMAALAVKNSFAKFPSKTLEVLKADRDWLRPEVKHSA